MPGRLFYITGMLKKLAHTARTPNRGDYFAKRKSRALPGFFNLAQLERMHSILFNHLLGLFGHRTINQFDKRHGRLVSRTVTALENSQVTTRTLLVTRAQI